MAFIHFHTMKRLKRLVFKRFDKHKDEEQSAGLVGCL
jgi:hypothetical protein